MTEQELREKIAHIVCENARCYGNCVFYNGKGTFCQNKKPDKILVLIKEAGWGKLETFATLKARARKRPNLIITDD